MRNGLNLLWILLFACGSIGSQTAAEKRFNQEREKMVKEQIIKNGITELRITNAFRRVQRHLFVDRSLIDEAYQDRTLPIAEGQSIQKPYINALMTSIIATDYQKKVLEIGTGTGYQTAILAELVREVYTIEINKNWAEESEKRLLKMGYRNIRFKKGNGYMGWKEYAPFDGIIVTCSPDDIPVPLIEQLAPGGRMVIPITYAQMVQELVLVDKDAKGKIKKTNLIPVQFVPMIRSENDR